MEQKTELQRNEIAQERRRELDFAQRAIDIRWLNNRMEDGRMGRCLALIAREAALERDFKERTDHASVVNARVNEETSLARAIEETRREEQNELLRRQQLRENDPALIELQKKLQAGYVRRDLEQQILQNKYKKLEEEAKDFAANSLLSQSILDEKRGKLKEEREKIDRTSKYCAELQQQLVNKQRQKQCEYEDTLIEKKMLDDVIRTMADEDRKEMEHKRNLVEKSRQEMVTFQQAKKAWKEKQKLVTMVDEQRIEDQKKLLQNRTATIEEERLRRLRLREEVNEKMTARVLAEKAELQEREDIIKQLQEQEYLEKNHQDDLKKIEKQNRIREEAIQQHNIQLEEAKKRIKEEKALDMAYRKANDEKMAADILNERDEGSRRKKKQQEYTRDLKKQIEDNAARRAREKEMEEKRARDVWGYRDKLLSEVDKERTRLLKEHVPHVVGFIQPGVIHESDLEDIKSAAAKHPQLASLDLDGLKGNKQKVKTYPKCNAQCRVIKQY